MTGRRAAAGAACLLLVAGCLLDAEPVGVPGDVVWVEVAVGTDHVCARADDGRIACRGANDRGQAGSGGGSWVDGLTWVDAPGGFRSVSAGFRHSCAADGRGYLWCWGANDQGQLGTGDTRDRDRPVPVASSGGFVALSTGQEHTCGVRADGTLLCWGANREGQGGVGVATRQGLTPTPVPAPRRWGAVAAGVTHTCGVDASGAPYCWGDNASGRLGTGTLVASPAPTRVSTLTGFLAVTAGASHTCGLDAAGAVHCWGNNAVGQVEPSAALLHGTPVRRFGVAAAGAVGAGDRWTCALLVSGLVRCWGARWDRLDDGAAPTGRGAWDPFDGGPDRFTDLSVGPRDACAVAVDGSLACWGVNHPSGPS